MLKNKLKKGLIVIFALISLTIVSQLATFSPNLVVKADTIIPTIIDAETYNLDATGLTDNTVKFQQMLDSFPSGSSLQLPKGSFKLSKVVKIKDNMSLFASNDVILKGTGSNTLLSAGNYNSFKGIEFQNCSEALSVFKKNGVNVVDCRFTNSIDYSAINFYGGSNNSVRNSYFTDIHKYGVLIDSGSSDITIDNNSFDNDTVFGGYSTEQVSGHVYCLNGTRITVSNNIIKNSGGQGIIFGYNSTTGKGTTSSVASNNQCVGNGQEGITIYGGSSKVTNGNSVIGNTSINNRFNQIEVWQSDNNTVSKNTVEESIFGRGSLGAICLFATTGTTCIENNVLSAQSNGIAIIAGTTNTIVSNNFIADTNRGGYTNKSEKGNGILLDWNGLADPEYITMENNKISSSNGIIAKSGVYSTSNTNHHNAINYNIITGYKYGVHWYATATCGI